MSTAGMVLAAGAGRRYGGPKALAEIDGERFVERAVRLLVDGGCEPVFVVLGAAADRVQAVADLGGATAVIAEDWQEGMSASLRAGLQAAAASPADAVVIALADQPHVGAAAVARLLTAGAAGAVAAVATYDGKPRNPVLLARSVWSQVSAAAVGDAGARDWLREHPDLVTPIACDGTGDPTDVDQPPAPRSSFRPT